MRRTLRLMPQALAICRFAPDAPLPAWVFHGDARFWSLTRTDAELSLVCPADDLPPSVERWEGPWRALALEGPIAFEETGVVHALVAPLAGAGVPVFVISTYDTDLLLVKSDRLEQALAALAPAVDVEDAAAG